MTDSATFTTPEDDDEETGEDLVGLDDLLSSLRSNDAPAPRRESKLRSNEYSKATLKYFLDHNRTTEDHDLWRDCIMHEEMLAILNRRFNALNPHKKGETEYESANKAVAKKVVEAAQADSTHITTDREFQILYRYTQETDEDGQTQEEIDKITLTKLPSISRLELEVQAAENYMATKWGITRKQPLEKEAEGSKNTKPIANLNPVLDWKELLKKLMTPNVPCDTIRNAVNRSIEDGHKKVCLPWAIGGCASEYQIVNYQIKDKKTASHSSHLQIPEDCHKSIKASKLKESWFLALRLPAALHLTSEATNKG